MLQENAKKSQICLSIHCLRTYSGNPNRGEDGLPKRIAFGNTERMRCSPASVNSAIRQHIREKLPHWMGFRTTQMVEFIKQYGSNYFPDQAELACMANCIGLAFRGSEESNNENDPNKTQILHFNQSEIAKLVEYLSVLKKNNPAEFENFKNPLMEIDKMYTVALEANEFSEEDRLSLTGLNINKIFTRVKAKSINLKSEDFPKDIDKWTQEHINIMVKQLSELAVSEKEKEREKFDKFITDKKGKNSKSESFSRDIKNKVRKIINECSTEGHHKHPKPIGNQRLGGVGKKR